MSREEVEPRAARSMAATLASRWTDRPPRFERNFTSLVYRLPGDSGSWYLRITPATHRSERQVASELALVQRAKSCGVPCAQPLPSRDGQLTQTYSLNDLSYVACVFEEAPGVAFNPEATIDHRAFFRRAGRTMGRLHECLRDFERPLSFTRLPWEEDRWSRFAEHVPRSESEAWALRDELHSWLWGQPRDPRHFGLIHGDFTIMNLRVRGELITLFDFDASCDHWYAYEIATFLHYFGARPDLRDLAYDCVLEGYASARALDDALLKQIPRFGRMRLLYSFLVFAEEWGFEGLSEPQQAYFDARRRLFGAAPTWPDPGTTS